MSEVTDCKPSADSAPRKRCPSPQRDEADAVPSKTQKTNIDKADEAEVTSLNGKNSESDNKDAAEGVSKETAAAESEADSASARSLLTVPNLNTDEQDDKKAYKPAALGAEEEPERSTTPLHQSESAAIAAAEALASLTGGDGEESQEAACSSERGKHVKQLSKAKQRVSSKTQAAAADSSTSMRSSSKEDANDDNEEEEEEADARDESISGSSSTHSSSFASDNEGNEENDDGECAIVSVKMAPEMRQSVTLLAQVQMKLDALEKKSAQLHQRLDVKIYRLRRPHLDQRSSIAKTIPGFWVTALLNHPHLSAHIDETDEDALSYMTDLEVETFKNNKLGYRIRFHFRRNPYFQNNIIMKELHLGMGGSPMSFSNPILWHRGHNLTTHSEPKKTGRGVYQTFFNWFSDHSNPAQDDVAQILKDDLFRDPLRYYLTPLWEPRENGSNASGTRAAGNGDDCVVISDSDDEPGVEGSDAEGDHSSRGDNKEEKEEEEERDNVEEEEEEEEEEDEGDTNPGADESLAEDDEAGEIVIDGSDETDQEEG
uniref:Testis specific protein Y-linked n=1 Tax=Neogobius melanostomus TaxID=47308 RepID=A0A8C6V8T1_9GOBI